MIVTGSQLDRIVRCQASGALPQVITAESDDPAPERGTAIHRFLERVPEVGREVALAEVDEAWRGICADIELAKLATELSLSREVALAYNWRDDTARLLTPVAPRAYEIDPSCEIAMTTDVAGVGRGAVLVGDYKGPHAWLPEPEQSYQLGAAAVALARLHGVTRARVEYVRIRDDGTVRKFWADLDVFGLEAAAEKIATLLGGLPALRVTIEGGVVPDVTEGRWCRYCPARQHCPAKTALVRRVLGDPQPIPYLQPLTPESALRAYRLLKPAKDALAQVEAALYTYAKYTPIMLEEEGDGSVRFFGELRRPGNEELDGAITHRVLTELFDGEVANAAVTLETTKAAITNAIRPTVQAAGQKITQAQEHVYSLVRQRGGAKRPETTTTTEYTVAPDGAAKARKRKAGP
jgi:hypothetical protein